jgi:hypothetical protein
MRHSLFFGTCADADKAEAIVSDAVGNLIGVTRLFGVKPTLSRKAPLLARSLEEIKS